MRSPNPAEERVCRALRQAGVITADQFRTTMDLLEATEPCDRCDGTGQEPDTEGLSWEVRGGIPCVKCEGTGQMRTIR